MGVYKGDGGVQGALPVSLSSHVVDSLFIQKALFEMNASAIKV